MKSMEKSKEPGKKSKAGANAAAPKKSAAKSVAAKSAAKAAPKPSAGTAKSRAKSKNGGPVATLGRPTVDEIRFRAYQIFLERGGQHGNHEQDWLQAERELMARITTR